MNRYLVSYDLMSPGRDYSTLYVVLERLGATRVLYSQWVLRTSMSAAQLLDHLKKYIDTNDRLLVNDFSDWASYNIMRSLKAA